MSTPIQEGDIVIVRPVKDMDYLFWEDIYENYSPVGVVHGIYLSSSNLFKVEVQLGKNDFFSFAIEELIFTGLTLEQPIHYKEVI